MSTDELEKLVRKLNYQQSIIGKLLTSAHCNSKIVVVKEKIEQLEEQVLDIPDVCGDLFEQWMETVVQLWDQYSSAASAAGHRPAGYTAPISYPQPLTSSTIASSPPSHDGGHIMASSDKQTRTTVAVHARHANTNGSVHPHSTNQTNNHQNGTNHHASKNHHKPANGHNGNKHHHRNGHGVNGSVVDDHHHPNHNNNTTNSRHH